MLWNVIDELEKTPVCFRAEPSQRPAKPASMKLLGLSVLQIIMTTIKKHDFVIASDDVTMSREKCPQKPLYILWGKKRHRNLHIHACVCSKPALVSYLSPEKKLLCGLHDSEHALWVIFHKVLKWLNSTEQDIPPCSIVPTESCYNTLKLSLPLQSFHLTPGCGNKEIR